MSRPAALNRSKAEDAELREVEAKIERELGGIEIENVEQRVKAEVRRARNRLRMHCVRAGIWEQVKAMTGVPVGDLLKLVEIPGKRRASSGSPCGQREEVHNQPERPRAEEEESDEE